MHMPVEFRRVRMPLWFFFNCVTSTTDEDCDQTNRYDMIKSIDF